MTIEILERGEGRSTNKNKILLFILVPLLLQVFFAPLINTAKAESDEYFYSVDCITFDSSGDGYSDAVEVRMDVDTTEGTIGVSVVANLYDPYDVFADSDNPGWTITGTVADYGYAYLHVPNSGRVGYYDVQLYLYDEFGNYEDYRYMSDVVWLYPPNYGSDEYFWSASTTAFDNSGDGYNDAVMVTMDVDTTDGSLGVYVDAELIDPDGGLTDHDIPSWTITGTAVEYGYAYLYVPEGGKEGYYDVELTLYDQWDNYEDYRYISDTVYLYPANYGSDEFFYSAIPTPFDTSGDGYNDAVMITMDVDTTDGTLGVYVEAGYYGPDNSWVNSYYSEWTITGTASEYDYSYLYLPNGALVGNYRVELYLFDEWDHSEDHRTITDMYLYPPDYASSAQEHFYSIDYNPYDSNGDGYNDAIEVRMDVDTTDGTLGVEVVANLFNTTGDIVDVDVPLWTITGTAVEYGYAYLHVPNGSGVGNYAFELMLYDEFGNYEQYKYFYDVYLYPPDYVSAADESFAAITYQVYDSNSDGWNDAVSVEMNVDTTDGTLDVFVYAYLIDSNGVYVDSDFPTWTITGTMPEYGYALLYVPNGGLVGDYHVELFLYDEFANYEDYRYQLISDLYPANYGSDEYFYAVSYTAIDSNSDGFNDTVVVAMDVDTTDSTLNVSVGSHLIDFYGAYVDSEYVSWTITGVVSDTFYVYLHVPDNATVYYYDVELFLYDQWGHSEDYKLGSDVVWLYPANYGSDEYFVSASPTAFDSNGDGYNDSVSVVINADTSDHMVGVYVEAYLRDPSGAVVSFDNPDWGIAGSNVEYVYASLYLPNGSPVGYCDIELYLYDQWGHLEDYRYFSDAVFLYPVNYPDFNGDGVVGVLDAAAVSAHWFPGPPVGPLGYDPKYDLNSDGAVDVLDAALVSAYWTGPPKGPLAP